MGRAAAIAGEFATQEVANSTLQYPTWPSTSTACGPDAARLVGSGLGGLRKPPSSEVRRDDTSAQPARSSSGPRAVSISTTGASNLWYW